MIYLSDIRDWLKSVAEAEHYYIGKLDNKQDKSIGVYSLKQSGTPTRAIGGESTYDTISVSLLIHYTDNARETEEFARRLYETLYGVKNVEINNQKIYIIELLTPEPIDVGTDDKGVYEQVIEVKFYYERK
nr:minor capsid protein [uncultured Ruminococcus sp.]